MTTYCLSARAPTTSRLRQTLLACAIVAVLSPSLAFAQTADQRMSALEAKVKALEAEIEALKANPPAAPATPVAQAPADALAPDATAPDALAPEAPASEAPAAEVASTESASSNPNAFNPAMSVILNGSYAHHSLNPDRYVRAGFPLVGDAGPGAQGFSLGESEFAFSSNIDDKFYGQATLSVHSHDGKDELGVEEAYIDTTAMPDGFSVRAGRFFSNIGYLNSHHAHTDSFFDRPLAYQAFLGNQYGDDGVQVRWVAPTDTFIEIGGEILRGDAFPSGGAGHAGAGVKTLFAHAGGDVGTNNEWLAGVSMLRSQTDGAEDGFRGDENLYIADFTWKWAPGGNTKDGGITLRSEYLFEDRNGLYVDPVDPAFDQAWNGQRAGGYVEGVWRINRTWDAGYRYDRLRADDSGPFASMFNPFRHSLELTWRNSEFSLVRLQVGRDSPNPFDTDNTISLQYQAAFGAHGAHKF